MQQELRTLREELTTLTARVALLETQGPSAAEKAAATIAVYFTQGDRRQVL